MLCVWMRSGESEEEYEVVFKKKVELFDLAYLGLMVCVFLIPECLFLMLCSQVIVYGL